MTKLVTRDVTSSFFWTDSQQASERLAGSVILYDNLPHYVAEIRGGYADDVPRAFMSRGVNYNTSGKLIQRKLDSSKFARFRELPPMGWVNLRPSKGGPARAVFLSRISVRRMAHGLSDNNCRVFDPSYNPTRLGGYSFMSVFADPGYEDACAGKYPDMSDIHLNLNDEESAAYSPLYAIVRDSEGLTWLYRKDKKIGLFSGTDTLNLLRTGRCFIEELTEDPRFTANKIQEF